MKESIIYKNTSFEKISYLNILEQKRSFSTTSLLRVDDSGSENSANSNGEGNASSSNSTSLRSMFDDIKIFLYGPEKDKNYLSPIDYTIELEQENLIDMPSLFDMDVL